MSDDRLEFHQERRVPQSINNRQRPVPISLSIPGPHPVVVFRRWSETLFGGRMTGLRVAEESVRSLEAGLISVLLLLGTFATFGVWFNLPLAYVLTGASVVVGLLALHWAHQASHAMRRNPRLVGKTHARLGAGLALSGVFASSYANGVLLLMTHPLAWIFWIVIGTVLLSSHYERKWREDAFFRGLDVSTDTSRCARCGVRIGLEDGRWTHDLWVCMPCSTAGA